MGAFESGATFENRNPANASDLIGLFPDSTTADADARNRRGAARV